MRFGRKSLKAALLSLAIPATLLLFMDSCLQFRMSKSEVHKYFSDSPYQRNLYQYEALGRRLNYLEAGDSTKPAIIFVHGSPGSLSAFIDFMKDTALLRIARLVSVDRPGFGASGFGFGEASLQRQAAMLKPVVEKYSKHKPVILVGHSLGGPVIARMAMDYPEMIAGLIMVAPSIDPNLEPNEWFRAPLASPFLRWAVPRSIRASNDEIFHLQDELARMLPLWKNIRASTIVIQGETDTFVPPGNAEFARTMLTGAKVQIVMVPQLDHFVPWRRPDLIRTAAQNMIAEQFGGTH